MPSKKTFWHKFFIVFKQKLINLTSKRYTTEQVLELLKQTHHNAYTMGCLVGFNDGRLYELRQHLAVNEIDNLIEEASKQNKFERVH